MDRSSAGFAEVVAAALVAGLLTTAGAAEPAGQVPRYHFQVGQELTFSASSEFKHQTGMHRVPVATQVAAEATQFRWTTDVHSSDPLLESAVTPLTYELQELLRQMAW